jgi:tetratricopeptide (TPR) repeat protein
LLKMSERAQGMRDHDTLDIYRLKLLTGTISGKDEYTTLAQLAVQLGFPSEAVAVITKAQAANLMKDDRGNKLLALAKSQAAADQANMAKNIAAAGAQPNGDALVKIGEDQWGMGNSKEAIGTIQNGMKKPLTDKNGAQVRLGMAYLGAGQKADAEKTFDAVKGPDTDKSVQIAHLWALYARH